MSMNLPRPVKFLLSYLFCTALYWQAINGTPIWDDNSFWFSDPIMRPEFSYLKIWTDFAWPFSVTIQKFLMSVFQKKYYLYHSLSLILHFANSFLIYRAGRLLKLKYPFFYFLLFLLHPVAVITTAWMIQIKTLLCFFFALSSLLIFIKARKDWRWMILSWILFFFSVASKSASLTLPLLYLLIYIRHNRFSKIYLLIPFFLISGWNAYKVLKSPVTLEGSEKAEILTKVKESPSPEGENKPTPVIEKPKEKAPKVVTVTEPEAKPKIIPEKPIEDEKIALEDKDSLETLKLFSLNFKLVSQTMNYYFWQGLIPVDNQPVKGLNYDGPGVLELVHLVFLLIMLFLFWKEEAFLFLGAAHFLLLPFLGFIPAPFMNITWVSDQHLYLVLPSLLAFWMYVLQKIKWQKAFIIPVIFILYFSYKTFRATEYYRDQETFYRVSLEYNPTNIPIAYNLGYSYLLQGKWNEANEVVSNTFFLAKKENVMKQNIYYPYIAYLYFQMNKENGTHEN